MGSSGVSSASKMSYQRRKCPGHVANVLSEAENRRSAGNQEQRPRVMGASPLVTRASDSSNEGQMSEVTLHSLRGGHEPELVVTGNVAESIQRS